MNKFLSSLTVLLLALFLCSCSSAKQTVTESVSSGSVDISTAGHDSTGFRFGSEFRSSGYIDISDMSLIFYPPVPDSPGDSVAAGPQVAPRAGRSRPAVVSVGHISAGSRSGSSVMQSSDSVGSTRSETSSRESSGKSEQRVRSPTSGCLPVLTVLACALAMIIFTGWRLYRDSKT